MDLVVFEENKAVVLEALARGEFDYIEGASEYVETEFFRFIGAKSFLQQLADTYPTPRKKEEVPVWLYIASNLSMRLHGVDAFHAFPMVVRTGGLINAFASKLGQKARHPDSGEMTLACAGFNRKNQYDRQTPCDQDFLRKLARDTDAQKLIDWFNRDVAQAFQRRRIYDRQGIFIGDASYLFVPDNPRYVGSVKLRFDGHHPVSKKEYEELPEARRAGCEWRRCYKLVTLLHTTATADRFVFAGVRLVSGQDHECPVLYEMVDDFVGAVGQGVMKRLIVDRGFLDGAAISHCKEDHGIDVLIPVRRNMDIYTDAVALFGQPDVTWWPVEEPAAPARPLPRSRPTAVERRERRRQQTLQEQPKPPVPPERSLVQREAAAIGGFTSWSACRVPLSVVAHREHYADGHVETWLLLDTREVTDPRAARGEYHLRTSIEERYRQLKCFSNLAHFTSRTLSLVVNQVVFVLLAYSLLQIYLAKKGKAALNKRSQPHLRGQLLPSDSYVIVCWHNYYGLFDHYEYTALILSFGEAARQKLIEKSRRMHKQLLEELTHPRAP